MSGLFIHVLGQLRFTVDDQPAAAFESDKVRALLVYLAMESDRPHRRSVLAGLLWPERPERAALNNLRGALSNLRKTIGDQAASPPFILPTRQTIQFNTESDHWIDATEFATLLLEPSIASLEEGLLLYQGPFLEGFTVKDSAEFEEWALLKREQFERQLSKTYQLLVAQYEGVADYEHALLHAWEWVGVDSLDENAHRQLMRTLAASGQRASALDHYETLSRLLAQELSVEPSEETQRLYQALIDEDLPFVSADNAEPRMIEPAQIRLPMQSTPFVGRNRELMQIKTLLEDPACRLITLTGPGGIGKTRLALEAADKFSELFADGTFFVPLESLTSADFLVSATAAALKFAFYGPDNQKSQLLNYLRSKDALLVFDNMEHLLEGLSLIIDILEQVPRSKVMVTSRERLNLHSEWIHEVGGMDYPGEATTEELEEFDAVQLFLQCALRVLPEFSLSGSLPSVSRICQLMQGLPLGIELSAAWLRTLAVEDIVDEIEGGLDFLSSSLRDIPERHRSLWAVFDYSWRLLTEDEKSVFRRLSVFRGGFERKAAEYVAGASLSMLSALVDKSLVTRNESGRYEIHALLQQYGRKRRVDAGEYDSIRIRHRDWFLNLAVEVSDQMRENLWGTVDVGLLERTGIEEDNFRIALQWSIDQGDVEEGLQLAVAHTWFWYVRAEFAEGRFWLEQTLALKGGGSPEIRALALHRLATFAVMQRDLPQAIKLAEQALKACYDTGQLREAGWNLFQLGLAATQQGELKDAADYCTQALDLFTQIDYKAGIASMQMYLGTVLYHQGEDEKALALIQKGLPFLREIEDHIAVARGLHALGLIAIHNEDLETAASYFQEGLSLTYHLGARLEVTQFIEGLATVACRNRKYKRSSILFGISEQLRNSIGSQFSIWEEAGFSQDLKEIQNKLSEEEFSAGWDRGKMMRLEEAVRFALEDESTP